MNCADLENVGLSVIQGRRRRQRTAISNSAELKHEQSQKRDVKKKDPLIKLISFQDSSNKNLQRLFPLLRDADVFCKDDSTSNFQLLFDNLIEAEQDDDL